MKIVYTGLESGGKSLILARESLYLVKRNKKWRKKWGFKRLIYSNLKFGSAFYEKNKEYIRYWNNLSEIVGLTGCDIIWDEVSSYLSAEKRESLPLNVNQWLRQGAKQGVHIYSTAQEFHDIHVQMRRRFIKCINVRKIMGSERPGENKPPVNFIWGIIFGYKIRINPYNELEPEKIGKIPDIIFITKNLCNVFDTNQKITTDNFIELDHIIKKCKTCNYVRIFHK